MGDFAGASGTITAPAIPTWDERRLAARLAREDQKRAYAAHLRDLERAAEDSRRQPVKVTTLKAPKAPSARNKTTRTQNKHLPLIRPCAGPCGRMTRPTSVLLKDAPGTITRHRDALCRPCTAAGVVRSPRPLRTHPQTARMVELYTAGLSLIQVSATLGVARSTVGKHLKRAGVEMRAPHVMPTASVPKLDVPSVRPCDGGCGRMTRPRGSHYTEPNVVPRLRDGKCSNCVTGGRVYHTKPVDTAAIAADYAAGMSLAAVGKKHGVSKDTASKRLRNAGVPLRPAPTNLRRGDA